MKMKKKASDTSGVTLNRFAQGKTKTIVLISVMCGTKNKPIQIWNASIAAGIHHF